MVTQLPKSQYSNSCGAQALRQAAFDLGVSHLPDKEIYKFQGQSIADDSAEEAIYGISGRLLDDTMKRQLTSPKYGGYSLPDGMLAAARELGLDGRFYCSSLLLKYYLKLCYPKEWGRASALCPVKNSSPPKLSLNERCIHAVRREDTTALHWLMERPDGSCYDPKDAALYKSLEQYSQSSGYSYTGVALLICDRSAYPGGAGPVVK
ncbi:MULTISPECIES: hypothetical protein [Gammaproteobacteria]|uniref:hypothetical protein n=1 Tax=Gammaproteobacteria TaxID=1236 RepID=UPI001ADD1B4E|nr:MULTISPECIES: hypothetical protein [Gammaproteobacteria]MBO9481221.1 hypothetical protein [Salinisphaera sp. G21_0]MBO9494866.1 hypothetical protein [Thalassotalea sp. G20_0]